MSPGNDDRPIERVERALEHEGLVEHVVVHDRKGWHWAWRLTKLGLLFLLVLLVLAVADPVDLAEAVRRRLHSR